MLLLIVARPEMEHWKGIDASLKGIFERCRLEHAEGGKGQSHAASHGRYAMILVTGATGTSGRELIRHLSKTGAAFKAMVRKEADREALEPQGVATVVADYPDADRLSEALAGVEQVYLIGPTDPPQVTHEGMCSKWPAKPVSAVSSNSRRCTRTICRPAPSSAGTAWSSAS
ncbi:NAD-dependent epimerase/dehydratase family protein [Ensifer sp. MPMI2T]|nr:NAD-dependent epimerase/dehydratase family protein [Ensifer sp. MPMI2T]